MNMNFLFVALCMLVVVGIVSTIRSTVLAGMIESNEPMLVLDGELIDELRLMDIDTEGRTSDSSTELKPAETKLSQLPRTGTVPYNILQDGSRYLLYSPSGGYNNQLHSLAVAATIASKHHLILIVPMAMRHTDYWYGYEKLGSNDGVPMDHCVDFVTFESGEGIKTLPLDIPLAHFASKYLNLSSQPYKSNEKVFILDMDSRSLPSQGKVHSILSNTAHKVVWLRKQFYAFTHTAAYAMGGFGHAVMDKGNILPTPFLYTVARQVVDTAFGPRQEFGAMHIRLGDFVIQRKTGLDATKYLATAVKRRWKPTDRIYVASEPGQDSYFRPLSNYFVNMVRASDLTKSLNASKILREFGELLPETHIRVDVFGIVEAIICSLANDFIGTEVSTFSKTILRFRKFKKSGGETLELGTRTGGRAFKSDFVYLESAGITVVKGNVNTDASMNGKDDLLPKEWLS